MTGTELDNIRAAQEAGKLSGDGDFSKRCEAWFRDHIGVKQALVTHSCTAALEMAALLLDLKPGDEVIMPSYTFVSTANAVALRGAVPVFVDIRPDTLNLGETLIEDAITERTKSIWVVHYAGVACEMDTILAIAKKHNLSVVEDAAQGIEAYYKGRALGGLGDFGALSFHETKNITCGEGGALLVRDQADVPLAEIIHQKGTDRRNFIRGVVDKYTWRSIGSSFLLGEMSAAFLAAQLDDVVSITDRRLALWGRYRKALQPLARENLLTPPTVPSECRHNAHMYYTLLAPHIDRAAVLSALGAQGVNAVFHYVPLHSSPAGQELGRAHGTLSVTEEMAGRLIRLPLWTDMDRETQDRVIEAVTSVVRGLA